MAGAGVDMLVVGFELYPGLPPAVESGEIFEAHLAFNAIRCVRRLTASSRSSIIRTVLPLGARLTVTARKIPAA